MIIPENTSHIHVSVQGSHNKNFAHFVFLKGTTVRAALEEAGYTDKTDFLVLNKEQVDYDDVIDKALFNNTSIGYISRTIS